MRDTQPPLSLNAWLRLGAVAGLLPDGPADVLEVGCGQGGFAARLARRYTYVGLEPDPASCAVARRRVGAAGRVLGVRLEDLPPGRFDVVCAFEVLEHLQDDKAAIAAWADRLRPGGRLLLSVPAYQRRFGPADELVGHFRRYDPPVLRDLLTGAGLESVEVRHYGMPLGYALESARNLVAKRRLAAAAERSADERSAASGRLLQPERPLRGVLHRLASAPFRAAQRLTPGRGPGLVAMARSRVGA
ncbi:class I SAM-dependent methyltransferase [Dactylosporangium sp. CS-033363]|uniref:class I SAM-dependent methyltransferase n=1 Tax=Dactylosporangium sp. CS-033363 TaxID=3239935 RepID=UPI003D8ADE4C